MCNDFSKGIYEQYMLYKKYIVNNNKNVLVSVGGVLRLICELFKGSQAMRLKKGEGVGGVVSSTAIGC